MMKAVRAVIDWGLMAGTGMLVGWLTMFAIVGAVLIVAGVLSLLYHWGVVIVGCVVGLALMAAIVEWVR